MNTVMTGSTKISIHYIVSFQKRKRRGKRFRKRELLQRLRDGTVQEIIDIGCAGALDPDLHRGDLVLSSDDLSFDSPVPVGVRRRAGLASLLQEVAARRGVGLRAAPILTHERFIAGRDERLELFESTGCAAVQMEHVWFLRLLQQLLQKDRFEQLRFTHVVLITDVVPAAASCRVRIRSQWDALTGYLLPRGRGGIASLRREVLGSWPAV